MNIKLEPHVPSYSNNSTTGNIKNDQQQQQQQQHQPHHHMIQTNHHNMNHHNLHQQPQHHSPHNHHHFSNQYIQQQQQQQQPHLLGINENSHHQIHHQQQPSQPHSHHKLVNKYLYTDNNQTSAAAAAAAAAAVFDHYSRNTHNNNVTTSSQPTSQYGPYLNQSNSRHHPHHHMHHHPYHNITDNNNDNSDYYQNDDSVKGHDSHVDMVDHSHHHQQMNVSGGSGGPVETDDADNENFDDNMDDDFDEANGSISNNNNNSYNQQQMTPTMAAAAAVIKSFMNSSQTNSASKQEVSNKVRKRSANQAYEYLTSLTDSKTFQDWLSKNETDFTWVHKRNSMTNAGKKYYYICNYRIKKGYIRCPAVIYALFPNNSDCTVMVYSCGEHEHRRINSNVQSEPMVSLMPPQQQQQQSQIIQHHPYPQLINKSNSPNIQNKQVQMQRPKANILINSTDGAKNRQLSQNVSSSSSSSSLSCASSSTSSPPLTSMSQSSNIMNVNNNIDEEVDEDRQQLNNCPVEEESTSEIKTLPNGQTNDNDMILNDDVENISCNEDDVVSDQINSNNKPVQDSSENNLKDYEDDDKCQSNGNSNNNNDTDIRALSEENMENSQQGTSPLIYESKLPQLKSASSSSSNSSFTFNNNPPLQQLNLNKEKIEAISKLSSQQFVQIATQSFQQMQQHLNKSTSNSMPSTTTTAATTTTPYINNPKKRPLKNYNDYTVQPPLAPPAAPPLPSLPAQSSYLFNRNTSPKNNRNYQINSVDQQFNSSSSGGGSPPSLNTSYLPHQFNTKNNDMSMSNLRTAIRSNSTNQSIDSASLQIGQNTTANLSQQPGTSTNFNQNKHQKSRHHHHHHHHHNHLRKDNNQISPTTLQAHQSTNVTILNSNNSSTDYTQTNQSNLSKYINNNSSLNNTVAMSNGTSNGLHCLASPLSAHNQISPLSSSSSSSASSAMTTSSLQYAQTLIAPMNHSNHQNLILTNNNYTMPRDTHLTMYSAPVEINVGGVQYTSSLETLTKYSESRIGKMFKGELPIVYNTQKQQYFIDREGKPFEYILKFMRYDSLKLPKNYDDYEDLLEEAKYYGLDEMVKQLEDLIEKKKKEKQENSPLNLSKLKDEQTELENSINGTSGSMNKNGLSNGLKSNNRYHPYDLPYEKLIDEANLSQMSKAKQTALILRSAFKNSSSNSRLCRDNNATSTANSNTSANSGGDSSKSVEDESTATQNTSKSSKNGEEAQLNDDILASEKSSPASCIDSVTSSPVSIHMSSSLINDDRVKLDDILHTNKKNLKILIVNCVDNSKIFISGEKQLIKILFPELNIDDSNNDKNEQDDCVGDYLTRFNLTDSSDTGMNLVQLMERLYGDNFNLKTCISTTNGTAQNSIKDTLFLFARDNYKYKLSIK